MTHKSFPQRDAGGNPTVVRETWDDKSKSVDREVTSSVADHVLNGGRGPVIARHEHHPDGTTTTTKPKHN